LIIFELGETRNFVSVQSTEVGGGSTNTPMPPQ
jgi:hypothetical protein